MTEWLAERELMLLLAGTAERRVHARDRMVELAEAVDYEALARVLAEQLLLPLIGTRLLAAAPGRATREFQELVERSVRHGRHRAALHEEVTLGVVSELAQAGIPALPLKGALLAAEIHGDAGLRPSNDIDLLVDARSLDAAVAVLRGYGYGDPTDFAWEGGLPLLHYFLPPERPWLLGIDLHWRIHWYEAEFSRALVERSAPDPRRGRSLGAADELAALLVFFARDSFLGLRLAADLAAWWDVRGGDLDAYPLDSVVSAHPELRAALTTAVAVVERLVGVPGSRLLSPRWSLSGRAAAATRLANWSHDGELTQSIANMTVVDWLLSPKGTRRAFARRYLFQPPAAIARTYGLPEDAHVRQAARRLAHGVARTAKFAYRYGRARWLVRGSRHWAPLPGQGRLARR
jgi:hypothetical protein